MSNWGSVGARLDAIETILEMQNGRKRSTANRLDDIAERAIFLRDDAKAARRENNSDLKIQLDAALHERDAFKAIVIKLGDEYRERV